MKICKLVSLVLVMATATAGATDLAIPNTFTAGTPAKAAEVNANFSAVEAAVDDNDARIDALQSGVGGKQERVTGTCAVGNAVLAINADGTVVCGRAQANGVVSVGNNAFSSGSELATDNALCNYHHNTVDEGGWFAGTSTTTCTARAPVSLPHLATLTGFGCRVYDGTAFYNMTSIKLIRTNLVTLQNDDVYTTGGSTSGVETLGGNLGSLPGLAVVDNGFFVYRISAQFNSTTAGAFNSNGIALRLYGCTINYQP
jgi:hypothetical protein